MAPHPGAAGSARDSGDPRTRAPPRIRARAGVLGARGGSSSRPSGLETLAANPLAGVACRTRRAFRSRSGRGGLAVIPGPARPSRAEPGPARPSACRLEESWWAGAESNRHSRRRGFYRPLGSPPARPTHDGDHADADRGTRRLGAAAILPDSGMVRRVRAETGPGFAGSRATTMRTRGASLLHPRDFHATLMFAAEDAVLVPPAAGALKGKCS